MRVAFPCITTSKLYLGSKRVSQCQLPTISSSAYSDFRQGPPSVSLVVNVSTTSLISSQSTNYHMHIRGRGKPLVRVGRFELPAIRVTAFSTLPVYQFPAHPQNMVGRAGFEPALLQDQSPLSNHDESNARPGSYPVCSPFHHRPN